MNSTSQSDALAPLVLVAYGPFEGRPINGSATLASALRGEHINGHPVIVEVLPVRWPAPDEAIPRLVAEHHPHLLLGIGEGEAGQVHVEHTAHNGCHKLDIDGQPPPQPRIDEKGPPTRAARIIFTPESYQDAPLPVRRSEDAGRYLCNRLLWRACESSVACVAFVHVPPQHDEADEAYCARLLPILRQLLSDNCH